MNQLANIRDTMSENTNMASGGNAGRAMSFMSLLSKEWVNKIGFIRNVLLSGITKEDSIENSTSDNHLRHMNLDILFYENTMHVDMLALYAESALEELKDRLRAMSM